MYSKTEKFQFVIVFCLAGTKLFNQLCCHGNNVHFYQYTFVPCTDNSKRIRLAGHVARITDMRGTNRILVGTFEGKNHLEDPGIEGNIILKCIFRMWHEGHGLD